MFRQVGFSLYFCKKDTTMKPIDKFEWKENRSDELSALEYCNIISSLYITQDEYQICHFEISENTTADMNEALVPISEAIEIFVSRYNNRELTHIFTYEKYLRYSELQQAISSFNLDKDKFWFLLLFIYDYTYSIGAKGKEMHDSAIEQVKLFIDTISKHVTQFDFIKGSQTDKKITLDIHIEGVKRTISITDATALHFIADSCQQRLDSEPVWYETPVMHQQEITDKEVNLKDTPYIAFFARMFLSFFNTQQSVTRLRRKGSSHSFNEKMLVSMLISFTSLSKNENWRTSDELLKAFIKQYPESHFWNIASGIYPMFEP